MAKQSIGAAIAALDAATALLIPTSTIEVRTGAAPADCSIADSGTLLATCVMSIPAFAGATDGGGFAIAAANSIGNDASADASGTVGHFRVKDNATNTIFQGTCGGPASGAELEFTKADFVAGDVISISSFVINVTE